MDAYSSSLSMIFTYKNDFSYPGLSLKHFKDTQEMPLSDPVFALIR